jgi:site-specific DNA-methyltransferase (adenine-specific)
MAESQSTVFNGDCMEFMAQFPDNYFELAIVDPPYGVLSSINNRLNRKQFKNLEPEKPYYLELIRVSKNRIVWGSNYLQNHNFSGGGVVWNKLGTDTSRRLQAPTIGDAEFAYQSLTKNIKLFSYGWMGNVTGNNYIINSKESKDRIHPTQKPVTLYEWLLKNYANDGDKILDTHMGSQSSRIAAYKYGFDFWGSELDADYFKSGCERFERESKQPMLLRV